MGKQFGQREAAADAVGSGDVDGEAVAAELAQALPAGTAGRAEHLALADGVMGPDWANPATFRFGASGLLDVLLAAGRAAP